MSLECQSNSADSLSEDSKLSVDQSDESDADYQISCTINWSDTFSNKHKERLMKKLGTQIGDLIKTQFPKDYHKVWEELTARRGVEINFCSKKEVEIIFIQDNYSELINSYQDTHNFRLKRQLLSLICEKYTVDSISEALNCTKWQVKEARKHCKQNAPGLFVEKVTQFREKMKPHLVDTFLQFITSDDYLQDVAYGDRVFTIGSISIISPNVIRTATHQQIFDDYKSDFFFNKII
jgi:hypothetical protein